MRVAVYVDGYNLFHAVDALRRPELHWLDMMALGASFCREEDALVRVSYFSAFATWLQGPFQRQRAYVAATSSLGVKCHMARFRRAEVRCASCGSTWDSHEEKETDVHFSLSLLEDAFDDVFDRAFVISADSDHVPAIRRVRERFPAKSVILAAPPKRLKSAFALQQVCTSFLEISAPRLERCLLPAEVRDSAGHIVAVRPARYSP